MQGPQAPPGPAGVITLPNGEKSIPVTSVPSNQRLVVDQVQFSPNPIRSRTEPITVRIKVKDTRGYVVRDALVFFRSTPLVTTERAGSEDRAGRLAAADRDSRAATSRSCGRRTPCSSS